MRPSALQIAIPLLMLVTAANASAAPLHDTSTSHIRQIEQNLLPAIQVAGVHSPRRSLAQRMRETHTPGVSIAFFKGGHIVWTKAWGYTELASHRKVTPETLFQAGSISKSVSAVGAMSLVQDGKLALDEDVNPHLQSWRIPESPFASREHVTLRRLLTHTAGLNVHGFEGYSRGKPVPTLVQALQGAKPANSAAIVLESEPGAKYRYSGGGYLVAQLLMTEISGKDFPELLRERVLAPAGMISSTFEQPLPAHLMGREAHGYDALGKSVPGGWNVYPEMTAAGLWTTPSDLARFAIAMQDAYDGRSATMLKPETARAMLTPTAAGRGIGFGVKAIDDRVSFGHSGENIGFVAELRAYATGQRQGVAIMTNGAGGEVLAPEILRSVAATYGWTDYLPPTRRAVPSQPAARAAYAGAYEVAGETELKVISNGGRLALLSEYSGPKPARLFADVEGRLFEPISGVELTFMRGPGGTVAGVKVAGPGYSFDAVRRR